MVLLNKNTVSCNSWNIVGVYLLLGVQFGVEISKPPSFYDPVPGFYLQMKRLGFKPSVELFLEEWSGNKESFTLTVLPKNDTTLELLRKVAFHSDINERIKNPKMEILGFETRVKNPGILQSFIIKDNSIYVVRLKSHKIKAELETKITNYNPVEIKYKKHINIDNEALNLMNNFLLIFYECLQSDRWVDRLLFSEALFNSLGFHLKKEMSNHPYNLYKMHKTARWFRSDVKVKINVYEYYIRHNVLTHFVRKKTSSNGVFMPVENPYLEKKNIKTYSIASLNNLICFVAEKNFIYEVFVSKQNISTSEPILTIIREHSRIPVTKIDSELLRALNQSVDALLNNLSKSVTFKEPASPYVLHSLYCIF